MADNFLNTKTEDGEYFAKKESNVCASILLGKGDSFFNVLRGNYLIDKIRRSWNFYHGTFDDNFSNSHQIKFTGEAEELTMLPVNHYRNIAKHIQTMITSNRPTMQTRAINNDYKSLAQTYLADGVLDYYMRERGLEDCIKKAVEMAIVLGTGYIKLAWNATTGDVFDVDPDTGEFAYEGDVEFVNLTPLDVVVDGTKESWNNEWILTRTFVNRFNLMAKYPEFAERIKGLQSKNASTVHRLSLFSNDNTDDIPVYEFFHKRTEALEEGRYMLFVAPDVVLIDTKMPYRVIPIFRIASDEIMGTPYGYSGMFDLLPIQESVNASYSTIASNQATFGVQNVFVPRGADINISSLEGGMNLIEGTAEPKPLNLTQTPAEIFKFLEMQITAMETISGISSVTRGQPEKNLTSGTALALVQSMSLQFISGLQQSYVKLIEDVGTALIQLLKDFAHAPKMVAIVGKNQRSYLKEFTGESLSSVNRVIVDVGNPLSRTTAGRVQMAEQLLQMKLLKTPEQYFQVMATGRLDISYESELSELLLIKSENERMLEGKPIMATPLDNHRMHIVEHKAVINDPDFRTKPELLQEVLAHIQEHIDALRNTDPDLLMMLDQQPLQNANTAQEAPPTQMQGQEGMPTKQSVESSRNPDIMGQAPQGDIVPGEAIQIADGQQVNLPNLPKVNPELLSNPELQARSLGNLRQ